MSNVVEMFPDKSGYITNDGKIEGVYNQNLAAWRKGDDVFIGEKSEKGIDNPVVINMNDLNVFCIMWLAIHDPEVLVCDSK